MKTYQVTVDGQVYEVTVQEATPGVTPTPTAPAPVAPASAQPVTVPQPAPQPAPAPKPQASSVGGTSVQAPMPGKVLTIQVSQGANVKSGDVLLILEATKMENDIVAPTDGNVASINVQTGDSVNTGDVLVVIE